MERLPSLTVLDDPSGRLRGGSVAKLHMDRYLRRRSTAHESSRLVSCIGRGHAVGENAAELFRRRERPPVGTLLTTAASDCGQLGSDHDRMVVPTAVFNAFAIGS